MGEMCTSIRHLKIKKKNYLSASLSVCLYVLKVEEEVGLVAGEEQEEADLVRTVMEVEVGGAQGLLAQFEPLLVAVVGNPSKYPNERLQTAASLALGKFMMIR